MQPMRKLLSKEEIFNVLHRESAAHFVSLTDKEPGKWSVWVQETIYHKFAGGDPEAAAYWKATSADPRSEAAMQRAICEVLTGPDFVDGEGKPLQRFDKSPYLDDAILAHAYFGLASHEAEFGDPGRARELLRRARARGQDPQLDALAELRIAHRERDRRRTMELATSLLPNPFAHLILGELMEKEQPKEALRHYEAAQSSSDAAEVSLKIARLHSDLGHFREAEAAFLQAESAAGPNRLAIELERADLYYRGSRYQEAFEILGRGMVLREVSQYTRGRLIVPCMLRMWRGPEAVFQLLR